VHPVGRKKIGENTVCSTAERAEGLTNESKGKETTKTPPGEEGGAATSSRSIIEKHYANPSRREGGVGERVQQVKKKKREEGK